MTEDLPVLRRALLRAFDLGERTAEAGRESLRARVRRWRDRWFLIAQISVTAGLAWWLAQVLLHHPAPFFAPVAAMICLGMTYGQRLRRGVEIAVGVAVGVAVGDVFVRLFGTGVWQVVFVVVVAMSLATLLGAGQLMITQAGVQALIATTLLPDPAQGFSRWLDAVVGCALALLVATIAPSGPLRRPGWLSAQVLEGMAETLTAAAAALRNQDGEAGDAVLERARAGSQELETLETAAQEGMAVVRQSPFRRRDRARAEAYAELIVPIGRAHRSLRVLIRHCVGTLWRGDAVPEAYQNLMIQLADAIALMARQLHEGHLPEAARRALTDVGEASAEQPVEGSLSAMVILAQCRLMVVDLLQATGLDLADARERLPEMR